MHNLFKQLICKALSPDPNILNSRSCRAFVETKDKVQAKKLRGIGVQPRPVGEDGWLGGVWQGIVLIENTNGVVDPKIDKLIDVGLFSITLRKVAGKDQVCFTYFPVG